MAKQQIEITLTDKTDSFEVQKHLLRCTGIKKVYAVTCQTIRVYFDDAVILPKTIAKQVGNVGKKSRKRLANIVSMREINDNNKTAA